MTTATFVSGDMSLDDEFRTNPFFSPETAGADHPSTAVWSDGKVSLAGLFSMQWATHELHLTAVEYLGFALLLGYIAVYIAGRRRNYHIAHGFIMGVHGLFCSRFLEAGPASEMPPVDRRQLLARDSCSTFLYYATGSRRCLGVQVTIDLASRHDLFMVLWSFFSPTMGDRVTVEVAFDDEDIEPVIFAVARKREVKKLLQEVPHLQDYAGVTRAPSLLPPSLVCLSESSALLEPMLPPSALKSLSEKGNLLELMYVTDQNDQPILGQEHKPKKVLRYTFRLPVGSARGGDGSDGATEMMELALSYIQLLNKFKMSAGTKKKALERRAAVLKRKSAITHAQRQERFQMLKNERLQREREEYEGLTPEQKRRRDLRDEKKAKKVASSKRHKMRVTKA
ncbi:unnamed protein product [Ectocarpus sp. 6 AP-2014]